MLPRYFFGFDCLENGRRYLVENGFTPISVSTVAIDGELVPAIAAIRADTVDFQFAPVTYLVFGDQWTSANESEAGAEFALIEDVLHAVGDEEEPILTVEKWDTMTWKKP